VRSFTPVAVSVLAVFAGMRAGRKQRWVGCVGLAGALTFSAVVAGLGLCLGSKVVGMSWFVVVLVGASAMLFTLFAGFTLLFIFVVFDRNEILWLGRCLRMVTACAALMSLIMRMAATLN
jgi:hypothetical protein